MSDIKIVVGADVSQAITGLRAVQGGLEKTASVSHTTTSAFSSMGSSIASLGLTLLSGGIALGVSALISGLVLLGKSLFDVSKEQQRLNEVLEGARSEYVKAVLDIQKVGDAFQKAKDGVISKEKALKIYNNTIGDTIGQTDDLNTAENNFIANADNYIKFTLLKAAANIALGKAADAAFNAELEKEKGVRTTLLGSLSRASNEKNLQSRISEYLKEQVSYKNIYNNLIAQANALGFKGLQQEDGIIGKLKERIKLLTDALPGLKTREEIATNVAEIKKLNEELDKLLGKGPKIKNIKFDTEHFSKFSGIGKVKVPDLKLEPKVIIEPKVQLPTDSGFGLGLLQAFLNEAELQKLSDAVDEKLTNAFISGTTSALDSLGTALGEFVATGKFDLPNLFGGLMQNLGSQLQDLGKFLITSSAVIKAAKEAFKKLLANPYAALAAGAALILIGAAIKSSASKQYKGFASGVRNLQEAGFYNVGERGQERIFLPRGSSVQPNNEVNAYGGGGITLMPSIYYEGTGFRIMLNRVDDQFNRNN